MNNEFWNKSVEFHGHECPGLAIGVRACEAAIDRMGIKFSKDEEIVCVTENDACCVDAVQVITGCTVGKGNIIYRDTGKIAFSFFNRSNDDSMRVIMKPWRDDMERDEYQEYILNSPLEEIFVFGKPAFSLPENARIFTTVICEKCGEGAPEYKMRMNDGKKVCLDCFTDYSRGW